MDIAIVGAGFCGLAAAWHLLKTPALSPKIVIYDSHKIGGGASGMASGLLHPYAGAHAKLNRRGKEGFAATRELIQVASNALGSSVIMQKGILRLALTETQKHDFALCASKYPDEVQWLESTQCQKLYPFLIPSPGIWIKDGITVNSPLYLNGLWKGCQSLGAKFEKKEIRSLSELKEFDLVIVAAGATSPKIDELRDLPLTLTKGQILELEWPQNLPPIPFALNSQAYLLMNEGNKTCLAGATYERNYVSLECDPESAIEEIMPKVIGMVPAIKGARMLKCMAGTRASTSNHLPLIQQIGPKAWFLGGMGSKGLLYHALAAQELASLISVQTVPGYS